MSIKLALGLILALSGETAIAFSGGDSQVKMTITVDDQLVLPCRFIRKGQECVIDTGSPMAALENQAGVQDWPTKKKTALQGLDTEMSCDETTPAKVELARRTYQAPEVLRCDQEPAEDYILIGRNFFDNSAFRFDFQKMTFSWLDGISQHEARKFERSPKTGWYLFPVAVGALSIQAGLDTGSSRNLMDKEYAISHPEIFATMTRQSGNGSYGFGILRDPIIINELSISNITVIFEDLRGTQGPDVPALIIGLNTAQSYIWEFDTKKLEFYVGQ